DSENWPIGQGEGDEAGSLPLAVPRRDDPVRGVGVRPDGDREPVPQRGRRRQHLARARGQDRAGGGAALRGGEAPVGTVPRAPRGRPPLHVRRRVGRQDRPGAPARRGAARFVDRSSSCPVSLHREGNTNSQIGEEYRSKRCL
ncbi:Os01g0859200, partial [Oryza sativa Japonica Group]